jgi:predicted nucleic acid-binding protein
MKTALDTSVILDVITGDERWSASSEEALKDAFALGPLVVGECVLAEITPAFEGEDLAKFLSDWRIVFQPSTRDSAILAGKMYEIYLGRANAPKRVLPDFLIGAHALVHAGRLLARDRGYYRDYFSSLSILEPAAPPSKPSAERR